VSDCIDSCETGYDHSNPLYYDREFFTCMIDECNDEDCSDWFECYLDCD
jgi:hypothetical protein